MAQLNYTEDQHTNQITKLDVHLKTDEVFVSLEGNAVLIAASIINCEPKFEVEYLLPNIVYNIPKDMWHNIAMEHGSQALIVEKSNTHISDFEFFVLSKKKQHELKSRVNALFDSRID